MVGYYSAARTDLVDLINGKGLKVLEVGCGDGATGAVLVERKIANRLTGIEVHEPSARLAERHFDDILIGDVTTVLPRLRGQNYDCVMLGDVLEHLVNPWGVLMNLRAVVSDQAKLVVSLPNVRFWPVVSSLVVNADWRYARDGVLDGTHLRFFTLKSAKRMFSWCGLDVEEVRPYFTGRRYRYLDRATVGCLEGFLAQRFLFRLAYSPQKSELS